QHAGWEVNRGAAFDGAVIERSAGSHVVADVGNSYEETESLRVRLGVNRVVEVPSVFAVDGDERQISNVCTGCDFTRIDLVSLGLRFTKRGRREFAREFEAGDRRFRRQLDRTIRIESLDDASLRRRVATRVTRDLCDHPVAAARSVEIRERNGTSQLQAT